MIQDRPAALAEHLHHLKIIHHDLNNNHAGIAALHIDAAIASLEMFIARKGSGEPGAMPSHNAARDRAGREHA